MRVVITGASSGLGQALAAHYAQRGATLGLISRRAAQLESVARSLPGSHHVYPLDVTDAAAAAAAGRRFLDEIGVPDVVIANAGVSTGTLTEEAEDRDVFSRVLSINVTGMVNTFHPFVGAMRAAGAGRLVGIASVAGVRGLPGSGAYSASKAAAISYLESLRVELRGTGVRVVTICPGYVATPMTAGNPYPMPFLLSPDEAARRMARVIASGRGYAVVPWQMALVARALRLLPNAAFDAVFARTGRKPRGRPL